MPTYHVTITRDVTESTVVEVEAETEEQAGDTALETLRTGTETEWEVDDGSWNQGSPYVTGIDVIFG